MRVACGTVFLFFGGGLFFAAEVFFFLFVFLPKRFFIFFLFFFVPEAFFFFFCKNGCGKIRSKMCRKPSNFVKFQDGCAFFRPLFFVFQCEQLFSKFLIKKKKKNSSALRAEPFSLPKCFLFGRNVTFLNRCGNFQSKMCEKP